VAPGSGQFTLQPFYLANQPMVPISHEAETVCTLCIPLAGKSNCGSLVRSQSIYRLGYSGLIVQYPEERSWRYICEKQDYLVSRRIRLREHIPKAPHAQYSRMQQRPGDALSRGQRHRPVAVQSRCDFGAGSRLPGKIYVNDASRAKPDLGNAHKPV
jgi:hypothetical protein